MWWNLLSLSSWFGLRWTFLPKRGLLRGCSNRLLNARWRWRRLSNELPVLLLLTALLDCAHCVSLKELFRHESPAARQNKTDFSRNSHYRLLISSPRRSIANKNFGGSICTHSHHTLASKQKISELSFALLERRVLNARSLPLAGFQRSTSTA
jgi:hypothetical protein